MKFIPDTIAGRILTLLLGSLIAFHIGSLGLYHLGLETELDVTNEQRLAERLASVKRAIARVPPADREDIAHSLSGGPLEIHWSESQAPPQPNRVAGDLSSLEEKILAAAPELSNDGLSIASESALPEHATATRFLLISMHLEDKTWVNVTVTKRLEPQTGLRQIVLSTTLMVAGVMALTAFFIRSLTRSLSSLAAAANRLVPDGDPTPVEETGPREVRALGIAFNEMQKRVKRLVDDRTQTLAAISHDLKTPLTRMRLRAEDIADRELAGAVSADLTEMEVMLDSTLAFLRGDQLSEEKKPIDLGPLLETICTDLSDAGRDVTLARAEPAIVRGRHLSLKRAMSNLIENAVKYGQRARVTLRNVTDHAEIVIDDDGPGIPEGEKEIVFRPFYRIDDSRNRETGGVGLGLTVARSIIRSHSGDLTLANREGGGLRAVVHLPR
jgi:signal transduction histidine kinase